MTSWKTTLFGLISGLGAGILGAYMVDPKLLAPFPAWLPGLGVLLSSIGTACLGLAARDNNKTSEDVGASVSPPSAPPRTGPSLPGSVLFLALAAVLPAALVSCGTLDPAGVYAGDKVLYDADQTIAISYDTLHVFVQWEFDNRQTLASHPEIKQAADNVRLNAPHWFASAIACRDAYKATPTTQNQAALTTALDVLHQAIVEASKYMATTPATPKT
jgi:hypothetical protein